jgi:methionyl-tRNA synthetase
MSSTDLKVKRYTITAALPYANGPKHIGHLAGAYIPADVFARYLRLNDKDVIFVCGSDEHGTAIPNQALKEGTTAQAIIDKYHNQIRECFSKLGISTDIYHRTSESIHHQTSQEFFLNLFNKGLLNEESSDQYYDEEAKTFLADRFIIGTCPKCSNPKAYGDQCENCGTSLSPTDLINPKSTLSGNQPILKRTNHWYLPLQDYENWLRQWILEGHKDDWKANVYGQCKSWIEAGLQPRAMTRDLDWGIKVPLPNAEGKVLYVWFDAPIGYISATRALFSELASGEFQYATPQREFPHANSNDWSKYWEDNETQLIHFIGKDNIVFHCIIFPIMLHASNQFIVPQNVPANEFMNLEGDKMSTSRGWSIEMHEYIEDFPDKADVLRYALLSNLPETKDSEFTWKDFQAKNNNELVAIFGNFVNRALVLTQKYFNNEVPPRYELEEVDKKVMELVLEAKRAISNSIEEYKFRDANAALINLARIGNKYLAETEPWKLAKTNMERVSTILNLALQIAANLSIAAEPFLPFSADKLRKVLAMERYSWSSIGSFEILGAGHKLGEPVLLFDKIEDAVIENQLAKLIAKKNAIEIANKPVAPAKTDISFEEFSKMDIRIGKVLDAEVVPKSKKLLKLKVDTGFDVRTVMSGIAEHFVPAQLIGQQVTILVNLAPRKIMGVESQGMILMVSGNDDKLRLLQPHEITNNGAIIS